MKQGSQAGLLHALGLAGTRHSGQALPRQVDSRAVGWHAADSQAAAEGLVLRPLLLLLLRPLLLCLLLLL